MLTLRVLKRSILGLFLFILITSSVSFSNSVYLPFIEKIEIKGNTKTLDYVIRREIKHEVLNLLDSLVAEQDRERIENLRIFSEVTWKTIPLDSENFKLVFFVVESIQNLPPSILPTYDEKTGWSLNAGVLFTNLKGRNQSLSFNLSVGGKDTYGLIFSDPWILGDHVSLRSEIDKSIYRHNFLDYNVEKDKVRLDFGKWFGENIKTLIGFSIESIKFKNESLSTILKSNYLSINPVIKYDTRNIYWNPTKGILWSNLFNSNRGIINKNRFVNYSWKQSLSLYHEVVKLEKKLIITFNGTYNFFWGEKDEIWLNYLGDSFTVRGWPLISQSSYGSESNEFRFGYELLYGSVELRKEIIPKKITNYGTQIGLLGVLFIDVGSISYNILNLNETPKIIGSGMGIRIPFPMLHVIRFDLGWGYRNGKWNKGTLHWGVSHKF
ncbi:MAG: BamA/TamA family outer membrane protein [Candidatus Neomarinimicrobiota bacterium]